MLDGPDVMREHAERVGISTRRELMDGEGGGRCADAEPEDVPMLMCALAGPRDAG